MSLEPTMNPSHSWRTFTQILQYQLPWRCYSSGTMKLGEVRQLANRFVKSHARVRSTVGMDLIAMEPAENLYFFIPRFEDATATEGFGALYTNGAVFLARNEEAADIYLFVDDETAKTWFYPEGYFYTTDLFHASSEQKGS